MSLKTNVESLLFALGRRATVEEIARYLRIRDQQKIIEVLEEIKRDYDAKQGPIVIVLEDGTWKMTVRDDLLPVVRKVVSKTELPKGVMETLAIVAYKAPVLQSEIVRIRTNKAYDHLALLEQSHYLTREKSGRTKLIKLAGKFFDYFDVPEGDLKARFTNVAALEQAIVEKEGEFADVSAANKEASGIRKQEEDMHKQQIAKQHEQIDKEIALLPEIDLVDEEGHREKLDTYESTIYEPEEKKLGDGIEIVKEVEIYKTTPIAELKKEEPKVEEGPGSEEEKTPEERGEELRAALEPESYVIEQEESEAPPEGTSKFKPEAVEFAARKEAKGMQSREGKGLFSEGMSAAIAHEIDEKVSKITGEHVQEKQEEHEHEDVPTDEVKSDVHVTPEEGEKEERKQGGPDTHAHPGKQQ
jgi:segregation and condensation protein B